MKHLSKLLFLFLGVSLLAASCNNTTTNDTDSDTSNGVIDSMPVDTTASGDTAVVVDSIR
ncbi:hypothetical protein [Daejeonella lutea]|uniref:Uncharacterized protein n=1 Tax=Daejeonella lutea TaxID=572036 RepID=A0A1T5A5J5_9SPHI|nr:hypothetical protein [Daejeonella lutea]SKB30208.1 hypothetical protein SAMN05661099_0347 [Daejeonella lutea]